MSQLVDRKSDVGIPASVRRHNATLLYPACWRVIRQPELIGPTVSIQKSRCSWVLRRQLGLAGNHEAWVSGGLVNVLVLQRAASEDPGAGARAGYGHLEMSIPRRSTAFWRPNRLISINSAVFVRLPPVMVSAASMYSRSNASRVCCLDSL